MALVFLNNLIGISATKCITVDHFAKLGVGGSLPRPERYGRLAVLVNITSTVPIPSRGQVGHLVYNGSWYVEKTVPCEGRKYLKALSPVYRVCRRELPCSMWCVLTDCCASTGLL